MRSVAMMAADQMAAFDWTAWDRCDRAYFSRDVMAGCGMGSVVGTWYKEKSCAQTGIVLE